MNPRFRAPSAKTLLRQTLRAALIGLIIGAAFGILTALGSWLSHQSDSPPTLPGLNYIIRGLDVSAFPGMTIATAIDRRGVEPDYVFSPGEVTSPILVLALCNALFWAALWALLLAWPGPVFALWLTLSGSWG
ncbi:MAG: hypothetical protein ABSA67_07655 [Candidatus Brocadiia bacterium]